MFGVWSAEASIGFRASGNHAARGLRKTADQGEDTGLAFEKIAQECKMGALIIRIEFWGISYYTYN